MSDWNPSRRSTLTVRTASMGTACNSKDPCIVILGVGFQDLSQVSLFLCTLILLHDLVLRISYLILFVGTISDFILHFLEAIMHGCGVHTVHYRLTCQSIKAYTVIGSISVLVVEEGAFGERFRVAQLAHRTKLGLIC